jgi:16S rRNA (guanine527-N7)-methyltransferase
LADDISALQGIVPVSRETGKRLETFVALLKKWQPVENLVSGKTLPEIWRRHVADSAQIYPLFPDTARWIDLGTGAGFPGMVVAILAAETARSHVFLVESNQRKCAFLRAAIRETGAAATVHAGRAEDVLPGLVPGPISPDDRVIGRAVAPLTDMLALAFPLMGRGASAALHKGEDYRRDVEEAEASWDFDTVRHDSKIGGGVILAINGLKRKGESG